MATSRLRFMSKEELSAWMAENGGYMRVLEHVLCAMDNNATAAKDRLLLMKGVLEQAVEYMDAIHEEREPKKIPRTRQLTKQQLNDLRGSLNSMTDCGVCQSCPKNARAMLKILDAE